MPAFKVKSQIGVVSLALYNLLIGSIFVLVGMLFVVFMFLSLENLNGDYNSVEIIIIFCFGLIFAGPQI